MKRAIPPQPLADHLRPQECFCAEPPHEDGCGADAVWVVWLQGQPIPLCAACVTAEHHRH